MELLTNLEPLLRTFWYIAIPVSLVFLIQTIMTFAGVDASDGLDVDFDGDTAISDTTFQLFSLRNLINFLLGFSWTGISFYNTINNETLLILVSFGVGSFFVWAFFKMMIQMKKLAEDNSFSYEKTLNKTAKVYLSIPEKKSGSGKITISVNGAMHELNAVTDFERIETGAIVRVIKLESDNLLNVEKLK